MRCKNIFKWSLLVMSLVLLTSCSNLKSRWHFNQKNEPVKMPKILFLYTFDFEYENRYVESYIDEDGNIYRISPDKPQYIIDTYEALELSKEDIIGQVDKKELKDMYQLFLWVPTESGESQHMVSSPYGLDVEMGDSSWYGFRYNKDKELEAIHFGTEGSSSYKNVDDRAQKIVTWLKEVIYIER